MIPERRPAKLAALMVARGRVVSSTVTALQLVAAATALVLATGCRHGSAQGAGTPAAQRASAGRAALTRAAPSATDHPPTAPEPEPKPRMLWMAAVGDIMLDRGVARRIRQNGAETVLAKVRAQTRAPYLSFANLECPLSTEGPHDPANCCFRADPKTVQVILDGGFDVVSLANNHSLNAGRAGVEQTLDVLDENGIAYVGANRDKERSWEPVVFNVADVKVGFMAYTDLSFQHGSYCKIDADPTAVYDQIARTKKRCDVLFVSVHWGEEYHGKRSERQRKTALSVIDAGADCILGHHPHTLQGIGVYKGKPILYSMGNFVFDQREGERMESALFELWWKEGGRWQIKATPVWIDRARMGPVYPSTQRAAKIARRLRDLSADLGTQATIEGSRVMVHIDPTAKPTIPAKTRPKALLKATP